MGDSALHAELSPSKRHRWGACAGSIREERKYPEPPGGPAANDGERTHTLLEQTINRRYHAAPGIIDPMFRVGEVVTDEHGTYTIDVERAKRVNVAMEYIASLPRTSAPIAERRVYPDGYVGRADMSGTVDCQIPCGKMYVVLDYKDGMSEVEVFHNPQLEQYAIGVLAGIPADQHPEVIRLVIVQPKLAERGLDPITWHDVTVAELLALVPFIKAQADATDAPDAPLVPGKEQCKYCRAKAMCPALTGMVTDMFGPITVSLPSNPMPGTVVNVDGQTYVAQPNIATSAANKDPEQMSGEELKKFLDAAPLVRSLLDSIEDEAERRLQMNIPVPGYKMVRGKGSRGWNLSEEEMVKKLGPGGMGIPKSALFISKFVSPAQAEKLTWESKGEMKSLSKIQLNRMQQEYVTQHAGKPTLAPEFDPRPSIMTDASNLFGAITIEATPVPAFLGGTSLPLPPFLQTPSWMK